jgi:DNA-binding response OmpR family regulator
MEPEPPNREEPVMRIAAVVQEPEKSFLRTGSHALSRREVELEILSADEGLVDRFVLQHQPDLVIMDADLPRYSAFNVAQTLRRFSQFQELPIYILSSKDRENDAELAGASIFLAKPVDTAALDAALAKHITSKLRKAARKQIKSPCVVSTGGKKLEGRVLDVSVNGVRVALKESMSPGMLVRLGFAVLLGRDTHIVHCTARIVRRIPEGYGMAFCSLDPKSRGLLHMYAARA